MKLKSGEKIYLLKSDDGRVRAIDDPDKFVDDLIDIISIAETLKVKRVMLRTLIMKLDTASDFLK